MLYKNSIKKGFSLAEVLISVLIVSLILIMTIPLVTKKAADNNRHKQVGASQVFYFNSQKAVQDGGFPCYLTEINGSQTIVTNDNGKCEEYEFVVPDGVHKIDITLVAGGGGGGGAAGSTVLEKEVAQKTDGRSAESNNFSSLTSLSNIALERIKNIKINYLTGSGQKGATFPTSTATYPSGSGGKSGVAIIDFNISDDLIHTQDYVPSILNEGASRLNISYIGKSGLDSVKSSNSLSLTTYNGLGLQLLKTFPDSVNDYTIYFTADGASTSTPSNNLTCLLYNSKNKSSTQATYSTTGNNNALINNCHLPIANIETSQNGQSAVSLNSKQISTGYLAYGKEGGKHLQIEGEYGSGGRGYSSYILCTNSNTTCTLSTSYAIDSGSNQGSIRIKSLGETVSIENPGGVGSGGAGGSAVRVTDFPVIPGERYVISVGSGGKGGNSGTSGTINSNGSYIKTPTTGGEGLSGSSSAIYDSNGNLILLVAGGVGGNGGRINTAATSSIPTNNASSYLPYPNPPQSSRYTPVILSSLDPDTSFNFDETISTRVNTNVNTTAPNNSINTRRLVYSYMTNNNAPLFELNSGNNGVKTGAKVNKSNVSTFDKTGGHSDYSINNNIIFGNISVVPANTNYNGFNINGQRVYNGLHFRYPIGNSLAYAGGLGGFSGLGSKGGCGGLFVGNKDGLYSSDGTNILQDSRLQNTITINTNGTIKIYNIDEFYSGCSVNTSDGASAKFIPPQISQGTGTFGQAGSGGGGGGWSAKYGAGKGGDGQNGYVLINWKK